MKSRLAVSAVLSLLFLGSGCRQKTSPDSQVLQLEGAFPNPATNSDLQLAIAASRANDFATSVIALDHVRQSPGLSANQLMVVEKTHQTLIAELTRKAEGGDAGARDALSRIEQSRSQ